MESPRYPLVDRFLRLLFYRSPYSFLIIYLLKKLVVHLIGFGTFWISLTAPNGAGWHILFSPIFPVNWQLDSRGSIRLKFDCFWQDYFTYGNVLVIQNLCFCDIGSHWWSLFRPISSLWMRHGPLQGLLGWVSDEIKHATLSHPHIFVSSLRRRRSPVFLPTNVLLTNLLGTMMNSVLSLHSVGTLSIFAGP